MIGADDTKVFPRFLDLEYPSIERGDGVWLLTTDGRRIMGGIVSPGNDRDFALTRESWAAARSTSAPTA